MDIESEVDGFVGGNIEVIKDVITRMEAALSGGGGGIQIRPDDVDPHDLDTGEAILYFMDDNFNGLRLKMAHRGACAAFNNDQIAFVARAAGAAGNEISVEGSVPESASPLSVSVEDKAITINFAKYDAPTPASIQTFVDD